MNKRLKRLAQVVARGWNARPKWSPREDFRQAVAESQAESERKRQVAQGETTRYV